MADEQETSRSVAHSLRQATQLLLQAAERLESSSSTPIRDAPGTESAVGPSPSRMALRKCLDSLRSSSSHPPRNLPCAGSSSSATGTTPRPLFQPLLHSRRRPLKYRPYSKKKWQHVFVCLSQVGQYIPLDTADRVRLVQAGLGEKRGSCGLEGTRGVARGGFRATGLQ